MTNRDAYVAAIKQQLDTLNATMDELEAKVKHARADAQDRLKGEIAQLRKQAQTARDMLDELASAADAQWDSMVLRTDKLRDAFTHSVHYFKSQL